jgi:Lrp/AsnC family transcriptional regulator for asnA, asnC and gidA
MIMVQMNQIMEPDRIDMEILDAVKDNARLSSRQIARKTGIPTATVNRRLKRLIKDGVIKKFATVLDYEKLGKKTVAYILIRCKAGSDYNKLVEDAPKQDAVEDVAVTGGQFDMVVKVRVKDNDALSNFIFGYLRAFETVAQTESLIEFNYKKNYAKAFGKGARA